MAGRTRYLKPDFFLSDELAELSIPHRMAFAGLWCYADRAGRMKDRPKKLKMAILPFDQIDFDLLLNDLHHHGFITRYKVQGETFIQVNNFEKHQKVHPQEQESLIPPPIKTTSSKPLPGAPVRPLTGYSYSKSKSYSSSKSKNIPTGIDSPEGENAGPPTADEPTQIFNAYCKSWGREKYPMTAKRLGWIKTALDQYGFEACIRAVERFRADTFEDRSRFNGIEYLFGKQERIDRWCGDGLFGGKAFNKAAAEHQESVERLELAKQIGREMEAKNANGKGADHGTTEQHGSGDQGGKTDSEGVGTARGHAG